MIKEAGRIPHEYRSQLEALTPEQLEVWLRPLVMEHDDQRAAQHTERKLPSAPVKNLPEGWAGSVFPTFTIGSLSYSTAGINDLLQEAFALDRAGKPKEAIEIYDLILDSHPNNPDAKNRKGIALGHLAKLEVDIRSKNNESPNRLRHARELEGQAIALFEDVVRAAASARIYDPATNTITLPNINKLNGNEDLRGLFGAVPKALYNLAAAKVRLERLEGREPYSKETLEAISRSGNIRTDLDDPKVQDKLLRESRFYAPGQITITHNQAVEKTLKDALEFARGLPATFQKAFQVDGDFRALPSHSRSGQPLRDGDLRREPGFNNASELGGAFAPGRVD